VAAVTSPASSEDDAEEDANDPLCWVLQQRERDGCTLQSQNALVGSLKLLLPVRHFGNESAARMDSSHAIVGMPSYILRNTGRHVLFVIGSTSFHINTESSQIDICQSYRGAHRVTGVAVAVKVKFDVQGTT
jgi:hypothetical protein